MRDNRERLQRSVADFIKRVGGCDNYDFGGSGTGLGHVHLFGELYRMTLPATSAATFIHRRRLQSKSLFLLLVVVVVLVQTVLLLVVRVTAVVVYRFTTKPVTNGRLFFRFRFRTRTTALRSFRSDHSACKTGSRGRLESF